MSPLTEPRTHQEAMFTAMHSQLIRRHVSSRNTPSSQFTLLKAPLVKETLGKQKHDVNNREPAMPATPNCWRTKSTHKMPGRDCNTTRATFGAAARTYVEGHRNAAGAIWRSCRVHYEVVCCQHARMHTAMQLVRCTLQLQLQQLVVLTARQQRRRPHHIAATTA